MHQQKQSPLHRRDGEVRQLHQARTPPASNTDQHTAHPATRHLPVVEKHAEGVTDDETDNTAQTNDQPLRATHSAVRHQTQQASRIDSNSQPMRTAHLAPRLGIKRVRKHNFVTDTRQQSCATSGSGHKDVTKPQHGTTNAGQHSGYNNSSIHTLYTAEILQPANNCRKEETRATTLCMTWHAQQEVSNCATIPTDTGRRGHPATTTSVAAGGEAMRVQDKQGQTTKER